LSADYDAPLSESGDYTPKFEAACDFIKKNAQNPEFAAPERPAETTKSAYVPISFDSYLTLNDLLDQDVVGHLLQFNQL
jgi:hypothetical protein